MSRDDYLTLSGGLFWASFVHPCAYDWLVYIDENRRLDTAPGEIIPDQWIGPHYENYFNRLRRRPVTIGGDAFLWLSAKIISDEPREKTSNKLLMSPMLIIGITEQQTDLSRKAWRMFHEKVDTDWNAGYYFNGDPLFKLIKGFL